MKKVTKAVNTNNGKGYPEAPEPVQPGANPPDPSQRQTAPQSMTLREAAAQNYIKPVQSTATGGINFVINHGRLHANGYRLLKEGKEVRSRVISEKNEQLYTVQADPKLIGAAPETVKDDFAADPSNPQFQAQPASKSAFEEAKDYVMDLADQGLLGEKLDQSSLENYAKALTGVLDIQQDGTDPNKIAVDMLRQKIEENSGSEVASALFNVDPDDPSHVDLEQFIKQIREKQKLEGKPTETQSDKKEQQDEKSLQEKMQFIAKEVLPVGFVLFGIKKPADLRREKARIVAQQGLQTYEGMVHGFVQQMAGLYLKHLKIPVSNIEDFLSALSTRDSAGNFNHFDFIKTTFMKLGYNATDAAKKAENYLNIIESADNQSFFYLSASGINRSLYSSLNLYNISDGNINPDDLYKDALGTPASAAEDDKPEDPKALEKEKALRLKQAIREQYLTNEELEYGILHILQKPKGYASLTIDLDRALNLEDHLHRKLVLALKNNGKLEELLKELQKVDVVSIDELLGKFDIQPSKLKNVDETIEDAKQNLFDLFKSTPTGKDVDAAQIAEHLLKINFAIMKVQVFQDLKAEGMNAENFDKEKVKQHIEKRSKVSLTTKIKGLFDWANGDITPEKDYPMVTDSGIAERQQQLAFVFEKPEDVKNAGYEKLKEIHKKMAQIGAGQNKPEDKGMSTPKAKNDELSAEIANAVEGALQGKDSNVLKVSKDLIYELNNAYIEMSQLGKDSTELDNKRNLLEKFLASRGLSPAGAKAAADAVLNVVKGSQPMSRGSVSVNQPTTQKEAAPPITPGNPKIEDILAKLESFNIKRIPKPVQGNLEKLKTYLDLNNAQLSDGEIQELFKHFNPEPPKFSFEEYIKRNPNRFNVKGNKAFIVIDGQEIPIPENVRASEEQLSQFIQAQEEAVQLAKKQKIEATKKKVLDVVERLDNIGKVKKQDINALVKELADVGMNETEARLLIEKAIESKKPILEAQVQAARKGLANSSKVRSIFTSDGKSLTSDEIYANISNLSLAVFNQISNYYFSDSEALAAAEKIVIEKYQEAKNKEKTEKIEENLGFEKDDNGKMSSSGEIVLALQGQPTPVKVKRVNKGYEFSAGKTSIVIPASKFSPETVDFDAIAQELEASMPVQNELSSETPEIFGSPKEQSLESAVEQPVQQTEESSIVPEIKNGKLTNVKDVASNIVGAILAGRPVKLASPLNNLNEDSWMALADAISKSKTFKKLKLSPNVADDIVFRLTSANPEELEFDLSPLLKSSEDKPKDIEYDEYGNVIRKSIFNIWSTMITKTVEDISNEQLSSFSLVLVIENYIDSLKQAGMLSEDDMAQVEMLVNDFVSKGKLSQKSADKILSKFNQ